MKNRKLLEKKEMIRNKNKCQAQRAQRCAEEKSLQPKTSILITAAFRYLM